MSSQITDFTTFWRVEMASYFKAVVCCRRSSAQLTRYLQHLIVCYAPSLLLSKQLRTVACARTSLSTSHQRNARQEAWGTPPRPRCSRRTYTSSTPCSRGRSPPSRLLILVRRCSDGVLSGIGRSDSFVKTVLAARAALLCLTLPAHNSEIWTLFTNATLHCSQTQP